MTKTTTSLLAAAVLLAVLAARRKQVPAPAVAMRDDVSYEGAIKAIMEGAHPGMEKLVSNMPGRKPADTFVPGISAGLSGADDITAFMKRDDLKAASGAAPGPAKTARGKPAGGATEKVKQDEGEAVEISEVIFRKYDIRGETAINLTPAVVRQIGQALSTPKSLGMHPGDQSERRSGDIPF